MNFVFKEKFHSSVIVSGMCVRMENLTWSHMGFKNPPVYCIQNTSNILLTKKPNESIHWLHRILSFS